MKLRVLDFGMVPALRSQAVYHGLAETIGPDSDPILSLVSPQTPYVCVGMHQEVAKEVDEEFCKANTLPIYRRHVGGGAVYLDENQLFTHFIYPRDKAPEFAVNLYPLFIEPVVRTYKEMGINANYRPVNDIHVDGRKIGGTGAASIGEATVMVGSFMLDFDTETMSKCLKVPSEKFRDKLRQTLDDYMTTMVKQLGQMPDRADIKARFLKHCADVLKVEPVYDQPTEDELAAIAPAEAETVRRLFQLYAAHPMSTCRMGLDPQTSVVRPDGRAHQLEGLFLLRRQFVELPLHERLARDEKSVGAGHDDVDVGGEAREERLAVAEVEPHLALEPAAGAAACCRTACFSIATNTTGAAVPMAPLTAE